MKDRLVRISFTLLAAATILTVMVYLRLQEAKKLPDFAYQREEQMVYLGMAITAGLFIAGVFTLTKAVLRLRKEKAAAPPSHG